MASGKFRLSSVVGGGTVGFKHNNPTAEYEITLPNETIAMPMMRLMTAQPSTSGTFVDFTSIPSWAKKITVMLNGVSLTGTSSILVQLGTSGGVESTGYITSSSYTTTVVASTSYTSGFGFNSNALAGTYSYSGDLKLNLLSVNSYVGTGVISSNTGSALIVASGNKTLSGTLDRIRITTVNGTDLFDSGSINILVEGY